MFRKKINLLLIAMLTISVVVFNGCDSISNAIEGALKVELKDATEITFISDYATPLKDLDQASIPWVFGSLLFTKEIKGIKVPVLFDADDKTEIKVDLKIQTASATREPVTVFDSKADGTAITLKAFSVANLIPALADYAVIPDSSPLFGGKTIVPQTFLITLFDYDWSNAASGAKETFMTAIKAGKYADVAAVLDSAPVPLNCETVKITVAYKNSSGTTIEGEKYLLADPKAVIALADKGAVALDPLIPTEVGFKASDVSTFLTDMVGTESCTGDPNEALYQ